MALINDDSENPINESTPTQPGQGGGGVGLLTQPNVQTAGGGALLAGGGGANVSAPSGPVGGQPNTTGVSNPNTTPSNSGLFTNLNQYLNNNQDNAQGLGSNVSNFFTNTAGSAQNTLGSSENDFNNQIASGTINLDQDLLNQALANPTSFTQNATNTGSVQNMVNGTYSGPTSFNTSQDYANAATPIQTYDQYTQEFSQPNQYNNLLSTIYQGSPYTPGETSLDAALLANNPNVQSSVGSTISGIGSLDNALSTAATNENNAITQAQNTTGSTNATASGDINSAEQNLENTIGSATTAAQNTAGSNYTNLQNDLNAYNGLLTAGTAAPLSSQDLSQLGLTQDQWNSLLGNVAQWNTQYGNTYSQFGPLSQFLSSTGTSGITNSNVATPDQYSTLNALQDLLGPTAQANNFITNPAQAGTAPTNIGSFNYQGAVQDVQNDINTAAASLGQQQQINTAGSPGGLASLASTAGGIGGAISGASQLYGLLAGGGAATTTSAASTAAGLAGSAFGLTGDAAADAAADAAGLGIADTIGADVGTDALVGVADAAAGDSVLDTAATVAAVAGC